MAHVLLHHEEFKDTPQAANELIALLKELNSHRKVYESQPELENGLAALTAATRKPGVTEKHLHALESNTQKAKTTRGPGSSHHGCVRAGRAHKSASILSPQEPRWQTAGRP